MSEALTLWPADPSASQPMVTVLDGGCACGSASAASVSVTTQTLPTGIPVIGSLSAEVAPSGVFTLTSALFSTSLPSRVQTTEKVNSSPPAKGTTPCPSSCLVTVRAPLAR